MSVDPKSPWAVDVCGSLCETGTSTDRLQKIRTSTDRGWLNRVIAWQPRKTQATVREAAKRRLRVLIGGKL